MIPVRLPLEVAPLFRDWLDRHHPGHVEVFGVPAHDVGRAHRHLAYVPADVPADHEAACALIRRLATGTVGKRRENGFTYGRLQGIEEALQGELASKDYRKAVGKVAKRRLKGWKQV